MTKPRENPHRELFGILGTWPMRSRVQAEWNAYFVAQNIDAFIDTYPTTVETLPERLSEMLSFDRRAYLVGPELRQAIAPLLDSCDNNEPNVVFNSGGVFTGKYLETAKPEDFVMTQ